MVRGDGGGGRGVRGRSAVGGHFAICILKKVGVFVLG